MAYSLGNDFAGKVRVFCERYRIAMPVMIRKIALDMFSAIVMRTPVDTGTARANWFLTPGAMTRVTTEATDKTGTTTIANAMSALGAWNGQGSIFISNSLPYIIPLEYGHSSKAPEGMVRLTVLNYQQSVRRVVDGIK